MAAGPNPLAGADPSAGQAASGMLPMAMAAMAEKAQGPGQDFSQQSAQIQGADPSMILRQLEQVNQVLGVLFVKTFQSMPNLANQISATMKQLSRALKEGGQAANVGEAIKGSEQSMQPKPPINFSPAMQGQNAMPEGAQGG